MVLKIIEICVNSWNELLSAYELEFKLKLKTNISS